MASAAGGGGEGVRLTSNLYSITDFAARANSFSLNLLRGAH